MTGQDAVKSAKAFNDALELDGVILTKLDGTLAAGRPCRSRRSPVSRSSSSGWVSKLDKLQPFHPDRMAQRILGQGDVATLLELAQDKLDAQEIERQQERMLQGKFSLDDFLASMQQMKKLGSMKSLLKMIPGMGQICGGARSVRRDGPGQGFEAC